MNISASDSARALAERSRVARWKYPTSSGRPVPDGPDAEAWAQDLLADLDVVVDAATQLVDAGDRSLADELAANAWRLWMMAGELTGGRSFLVRVLGAPGAVATRARALALYGDGLFAFHLSDLPGLRERNEEASAIARKLGDEEALVLALLGLSRAAFLEGDHEQARLLAAESRTHAAGLTPAMGQAPLHMHGQAARALGELDDAARLLGESLDLNRRIGDVGMIPVELHNLGHLEIHRGNIDRAESLFEESASLNEVGDTYGVAMGELNRGVVAFARGDRAAAATRLALVDVILAEHYIELAPDDRRELEGLRASIEESGS